MLHKNDEDQCVDDDVGSKQIPRLSSTSTNANSMTSTTSLNSSGLNDDKSITADEENDLLKQLEASSRGKIKGSLYANYFGAAKQPFGLVFLVFSFLVSQILASVADVWVSYWYICPFFFQCHPFPINIDNN